MRRLFACSKRLLAVGCCLQIHSIKHHGELLKSNLHVLLTTWKQFLCLIGLLPQLPGTGRLNGRSEELLGRFIREYPGPQRARERVLIATKLAAYPWRLTPGQFVSAVR